MHVTKLYFFLVTFKVRWWIGGWNLLWKTKAHQGCWRHHCYQLSWIRFVLHYHIWYIGGWSSPPRMEELGSKTSLVPRLHRLTIATCFLAQPYCLFCGGKPRTRLVIDMLVWMHFLFSVDWWKLERTIDEIWWFSYRDPTHKTASNLTRFRLLCVYYKECY